MEQGERVLSDVQQFLIELGKAMEKERDDEKRKCHEAATGQASQSHVAEVLPLAVERR